MKISVLMRSRNDRTRIEATIRGILSQKIDAQLELVNVDNHSTDGTWELIQSLNPHGVLLQWPAGEYVPGKVLNFGIRHCSGEIVVFHNSDCVPLHDEYLAELVQPLMDGRAGVTFAQQCPCGDARLLIRKDYERAFGDGSESGLWRHFFSLASAAARRELLLRQPFDERLQYSEDVEWSWRLKKLGTKILYIPQAMVEHSHNYSLSETARRFYNEGRANALIFGDQPTFWRGFLFSYLRETGRDAAFLIRENGWTAWPRELAFRLVQRWNFYRGLSARDWRK